MNGRSLHLMYAITHINSFSLLMHGTCKKRRWFAEAEQNKNSAKYPENAATETQAEGCKGIQLTALRNQNRSC
ncbi:hypothetical protein NDU88_000178 [Pleurodeles waltl]|uniref:Uncharacterized protein n=1 Tax=Pleurodeles waltl TaxID=8319 RepID=A0AAV7TGE7_PLEWA|nr:hypothetical protein NDU88_000178 [Pleurodeles waltl]